MAAPFIDSHCHLSDVRMEARSEIAIREALGAGVGCLMLGGVQSSEWACQLELKKKFPEVIRSSFGIHPWRIEQLAPTELEREFELLRQELPKADALGETGLDFYKKRNPECFALQEEFFRRSLLLAENERKPLVLHIVHAHARARELVKAAKLSVPLMIHSFSGSAEDAKEWVKLGALLSFSGGIARKSPDSGRRAKAALKMTPLSNLLFETDAPDQAFCEGIHEPRLVVEVYQAASRILGVPLPELKEKVAENFSKIR
ncbi:MAG: TatD family hydrolase [Bdellovibrionales bacterium]|nr:TatD family hydrolase [Bdellovibrionales bacterium]